MGRAKNRRNRKMKQMNFWEKRKAQFDRHPQSTVEEKDQEKIVATNCLHQIKKMFCPNKPEIEKLTFSPLAWVKINCYINLIGNLEITGLGKVEEGIITDLKLIEQSVKSALVDCTADHMIDFIREVGGSEIAKWTLDWHSHVNMGVTPSGTDTSNWATMFEAREHKQFPVMIINKRQEVYCHCYMGDGDSEAIKVERHTVTFTKEEIEQIYNDCKLEVESKCSKESYSGNYNYNHNNSTVHGGYNPIGYGSSYNYYDDDDYYYNKEKKIIVPNNYSSQKITSNSTIEKNDRTCCFCGVELSTKEELANNCCSECFDKYGCETSDDKRNTIDKCPNCGCELSDDEAINGICDDCAETLAHTMQK